jgi:NADH-quinone oxidoreductase subunit G
VLLAGFEPEEESPIVFLRLRKAVRRAARASSRSRRSAARARSRPPPGCCRRRPAEAAVLTRCWAAPHGACGGRARAARAGRVILVGERLAATPAPCPPQRASPPRPAPGSPGSPRRAGERGAVDAGTLPGLLPGGRTPPTPPTSPRCGARCPSAGRDLDGILTAARDGGLSALVVGAVDPADCPDPWLALDALDRVPFLVSLELRRSPVTDRADVVLPVAARGREGRHVPRLGGPRPSRSTRCCTASGA